MADAQTAQSLRRQIAERVTAVMAPGIFFVFLAGAAATLLISPIEWRRVVVTAFVSVACGFAWWLGRLGRTLLAAHAVVAALTSAAVLSMCLVGGVHAPGYWAAVVIVGLVSWVHGARQAIAFAVFWVLVGSVFLWLERAGLLPAYQPASPTILWIAVNLLVFASLLVSIIPGRMLHRSLAISEAARLEAETAREAEAAASRALAAQEAALRESEAFRRRVFESSRMPIVVADGETLRYLDCNPAATAIYRFASREDTLGKTPMDVSAPVQPDGSPSQETARAYCRRALTEGMVVFEWRHQRPDGELWDAEVQLMGFESEGRQLLQFTLQDITDRKRAEAFAHDAETRLAAAIEAGGLACYEWDADADTLVLDAAARAMAGVQPGQVSNVRDYWLTHIHPDDAAVAAEMTRRLISGELTQGWLEYRYQHPEKGWRWISHSARLLTGEQHGGRRRMVGILQDITDRKRAEDELRLSEARFRALVENAPEAIVVVDAERGTFADVNEKACRLFGLERQVLLTRGPADLSPPTQPDGRASADAAAERIRRAVDGELLHFDWMHRDALGQDVPCEIHLNRLPGGPGVRLRGSIVDISERKQAEARIRQQAALLDITQDAVCVLRPDGSIGYWNRAAEDIFGWTGAEAASRRAEELMGQGCEEDLRAALAQVVERGTWSGELRALTKARRPIVTLTRASAVRDEAGRPAGCLLVSTDVTEQHQLEKRYLRAQRLESLGALASGIAHDLNNVLAPIVMSLDLLGDSLRSSEDQATLELLQTSAQRGAGIVKQLLTFARGSETRHTEVNTRYILAEVGKLVEQTFPRDIRFQLSFPQDVWNLVGDATQVHQVLLNLCVNARDALAHGGRLSIAADNVEIDASYAQLNPDARPGRYVRLRVTDTGGGIPPEALDRIFDPFFTTKAPGKGTGLGLATVQTIVRNHRGFVEVDSVVGQGTEFRVCVPAAQGGAEGAAPAAAPSAARGQGELVLVVDDEPAVRTIAQSVLGGAGYRVMTAADGAEGLRLFRERAGEIRLVIVDMMMPALGGADVIEAIRGLDPVIPIVAISGLPARRDDAERAGGGAVRFLQKPFTATEVLLAAAAALGRSPKG
jgi:PAS domain S-box-containing protein